MIASVGMLYVHAQTQTPPKFKAWLLSTCFFFSMPKEFQLNGVFRSDNLEKLDGKSILS